ncbi:cathepsin M-like [Galendromus occidentalis]|uniref:Cathepsin M-like n=1 Tax=Galendromus occidentalis TaxID=34638 RepID=A0AAJ6QT28_9ACAR|nr:cathepsin M-like [Galendromus occidentalis]
MESDFDYPDTEKLGTCNSSTPRTTGPELHYRTILPDNEDRLAYSLNQNGPLVVVYIRAVRSYCSKGIYNDHLCRGAVAQAMLLDGIEKDDNGDELWILKNSRGTPLGDKGFINPWIDPLSS